MVARLAGTPAAYGRTWHFAGAGVTTQMERLREIELQTGRLLRKRVLRVSPDLS